MLLVENYEKYLHLILPEAKIVRPSYSIGFVIIKRKIFVFN